MKLLLLKLGDEMNYKYLTKKQANIIYKYYMGGQINVSREFIDQMYKLVGISTLQPKQVNFIYRIEDAISYLFQGNFKFAQARIDGCSIVEKTVIWDIKELTEDDINSEYPFGKVGEIVNICGYYEDVE